MSGAVLDLWAVHIADGVLTPLWLGAGFALAALLALFGAWRMKEEEIAHVAMLTAAFFVVSLIHVRIGPTSVHLLLNGLMGVILGRRAALAIPVGLFLQAALIGHGGFTTLGINTCVMAAPALLAWQLFALLRRVRGVRRGWFRAGLVATSSFLFVLSVAFAVALFVVNGFGVFFPGAAALGGERWSDSLQIAPAAAIVFHPLALTAAALVSAAAACGERRLENAPEFPIGLLVGVVAVVATVILNCLALMYGGGEHWQTLALLVAVAHLPIAVVEGTILGFTVGFLVQVKPEMLSWSPLEKNPCLAETGVRS